MGKRHMQRQNPYLFGVAIKLRGMAVRYPRRDETMPYKPCAPFMNFAEAQKLKDDLVEYFGKQENVEYATLIRE